MDAAGSNRPRRQHVMKIRLSTDEREGLSRKAHAAGVTIAELLRDHGDKVAVVNRLDWRLRTYQLGKIGVNLNQLARWANTYKSSTDALQVTIALLRLERAIRDEYGLDNDHEPDAEVP